MTSNCVFVVWSVFPTVWLAVATALSTHAHMSWPAALAASSNIFFASMRSSYFFATNAFWFGRVMSFNAAAFFFSSSALLGSASTSIPRSFDSCTTFFEAVSYVSWAWVFCTSLCAKFHCTSFIFWSVMTVWSNIPLATSLYSFILVGSGTGSPVAVFLNVDKSTQPWYFLLTLSATFFIICPNHDFCSGVAFAQVSLNPSFLRYWYASFTFWNASVDHPALSGCVSLAFLANALLISSPAFRFSILLASAAFALSTAPSVGDNDVPHFFIGIAECNIYQANVYFAISKIVPLCCLLSWLNHGIYSDMSWNCSAPNFEKPSRICFVPGSTLAVENAVVVPGANTPNPANNDHNAISQTSSMFHFHERTPIVPLVIWLIELSNHWSALIPHSIP